MLNSTPAGPPLLLTPKQAADALAISPRKLWGLTFETTPPLPFVRVGRLVRYRIDDLQTWIDARRQGGQR